MFKNFKKDLEQLHDIIGVAFYPYMVILVISIITFIVVLHLNLTEAIELL